MGISAKESCELTSRFEIDIDTVVAINAKSYFCSLVNEYLLMMKLSNIIKTQLGVGLLPPG